MSPTSYQTAPPRTLIVTTRSACVKLQPSPQCGPRPQMDADTLFGRDVLPTATLRAPTTTSLPPNDGAAFALSILQHMPLASRHDLLRIDGLFIDLFFQNLSVFSDQKVDAPRRFVLVGVQAVVARDFSAPVTQQGKRHSNLISEGFIGEGTIHAHTQDLGVGSFQRFQILLEIFHLLRSTTREGKNIKRKHNVLLAAVVAEFHVFQVTAVEIMQREV